MGSYCVCYFSLGLTRRKIFLPFLGDSSFISFTSPLHFPLAFTTPFPPSTSRPPLQESLRCAPSPTEQPPLHGLSHSSPLLFHASSPLPSFFSKDWISSCSCAIWVAYVAAVERQRYFLASSFDRQTERRWVAGLPANEKAVAPVLRSLQKQRWRIQRRWFSTYKNTSSTLGSPKTSQRQY